MQSKNLRLFLLLPLLLHLPYYKNNYHTEPRRTGPAFVLCKIPNDINLSLGPHTTARYNPSHSSAFASMLNLS
jgi:hypothetical protein